MKINRVKFVEAIALEGNVWSTLEVRKGFEITFEAGLVKAVGNKSHEVAYIPLTNVVYFTPADDTAQVKNEKKFQTKTA